MAQVQRVTLVCDGCGSEGEDVQVREDFRAVVLEACEACWSPAAALVAAGRRRRTARRRRTP